MLPNCCAGLYIASSIPGPGSFNPNGPHGSPPCRLQVLGKPDGTKRGKAKAKASPVRLALPSPASRPGTKSPTVNKATPQEAKPASPGPVPGEGPPSNGLENPTPHDGTTPPTAQQKRSTHDTLEPCHPPQSYTKA